jgi:hypothetical protein
MAAADWGMCKDCQWWQIDPGATIADDTMGVCTDGPRGGCGPEREWLTIQVDQNLGAGHSPVGRSSSMDQRRGGR